jgi:hypothetical protein
LIETWIDETSGVYGFYRR